MSRFASHRSPLKTALLAAMVVIAAGFTAPPAHAAGPFKYFAVTPCRVADTRYSNTDPNCPVSGNCTPALVGNANPTTGRLFQIEGHCGVPTGAAAVTVNVTAVSPNMTVSSGFLTIW